MSPSVLVTGGAGYIGSHACKALAEAGFEPVAVDSLVAGHRWAARWGPLVEADILDADALDSIFERFRPVAVMHFAGLIAVGESMRDPGIYYRVNVGGLLSVAEAAVRAGVDRLVFSSSASVYGVSEKPLLTEDVPKQPISPYAFSKLAGERVLGDFDRAYGLRSVSLRYFNAAGADPGGLVGEAHDPETHLIPLVIRSCLDPDFELEVFGTDYPTADGTAIRDYIHVSDLASAHVAALSHLLDGGATTALNLGTGRGYSVAEVVGCASRIAGRPARVRHGPRREGDSAVLVADPTAARRLLAWEPALSDIETIIRTALAWHHSRGF